MTVLNGQLALSPQGGYVNPCVTKALRSVDPTWIGWPTLQTDIGTAPAATVARGTPAQPGYAINGMLAQSYMDDYYYRVHLRPGSLALGNISTAQQRTVEVWNAWPTRSLTLNDVQLSGGDGIALTAPGALPMTFTPLLSATWQVSVGINGPARVGATLAWLFANPGDDVQLDITGQRFTAWTVLPDWSSGITEALAWSTDAGRALDGTPARTPLKPAPLRTWEFPVLADTQDRQVMETLLYDGSARVFALPVWVDLQTLAADLAAGATAIACATADLDFAVGDQIMLWRATTVYELAEVAAVGASALTLARPTLNAWPAGTRLYPCRLAQVTDWPAITRQSDMASSISVRFRAAEDCTWPAVAPAATYLGYPVLEDSLEWSEDPTAQYARTIVSIDNDIGLPATDDFSQLAWPTQSHAWQVYGRSARAALRSLLYWLQGRAQALWLPSWQSDITLAAALASNATSLTIAWMGLARYLHQQPGRRHIRIELASGAVFYRRITAATDGQSTETVAIDSALGVAVAPADVRRISWMMLSTLATDNVEIQHLGTSEGAARCVATFAGEPMDEP